MKKYFLCILFLINIFDFVHSSCQCGPNQNVSASSIASISVGSPSENGISCGPIICSTTILLEDNSINGCPAGATVKILPCQNLSNANRVTLRANNQTFNSCQSDVYSFTVTDTNVFTFVFKIQTPIFFIAVLQPTPQPTTAPTTTSVRCDTSKITQDICLIYDVTKTDDDINDRNVVHFVSSVLFPSSLYSYGFFNPIPVPFPRTSDFAAANAIPYLFSDMGTIQHYQATINIQSTLTSYFSSSQSIIDDALTYLIANPLKRRLNVAENVIIVARNANYIDQSTINNICILKNYGFIVLTIGVGNNDFSKLFNLATSKDYTFIINDLNNYDNVSKVVESVARKFCAI